MNADNTPSINLDGIHPFDFGNKSIPLIPKCVKAESAHKKPEYLKIKKNVTNKRKGGKYLEFFK